MPQRYFTTTSNRRIHSTSGRLWWSSRRSTSSSHKTKMRLRPIEQLHKLIAYEAEFAHDWTKLEEKKNHPLFISEWAHGEELPYWFDQQALETEIIPAGKHRSSRPLPNLDPKHLLRTSSYPEPQQQHPQQHHLHFSSEPILMMSSPNPSTFSNSQPQMPGLHHGYGGNMAKLIPATVIPSKWFNSTSINATDVSGPAETAASRSASFNHLSGIQSQLFNPHRSLSPPRMNQFEAVLGIGDHRPKSSQKGRQNPRFSQQGFDIGWPQFRSKYMSPDEIEGILRMQLAATHTHANAEPRAFLQVDALGRVPFSSIRRPRPLLEVDPPTSSAVNNNDQKASYMPLEQEPMLAARVTIEDGLCLLLDVDDIERFLQFNQLQDGGAQLRQRRQVLLEGLAASLQLVDPLGKNGHTDEPTQKDDLVFLRIVPFPKAGSCLQGAAETITKLAKVVSSCVHEMDIHALTFCLAAVVCSSEQPPLRPLGSPAGDGASFILKCVLDRATKLVADLRAGGDRNMSNQSLWKTSFNEFFKLLTKYCINKYDTVMQSLRIDVVLRAVSNAISLYHFMFGCCLWRSTQSGPGEALRIQDILLPEQLPCNVADTE
ncbi:Nucleic acid-binding, OB-fold-like protein [Hibiscus syriacus]|uniref:Nucleic acid-binding, OB-fold-like protein n=1 Tax=Hibiscus syriacus TaxID=106335 RepID=A0A6A3D2R0_HIBSY|nr:Nucleic acid-binding, OB-fold-like protein [Hibiscus syriacus]